VIPASGLAHVVVDASALVDFFLRPLPERLLATLIQRVEGELHAPALGDGCAPIPTSR